MTDQKKPFLGYTNVDGTRIHDAPKNWVFGTIGPVSDYGVRFVPEELIYEQEPKARKSKKTKSVEVLPVIEAIGTPIEDDPDEVAGSVFDLMSTYLSTLGATK